MRGPGFLLIVLLLLCRQVVGQDGAGSLTARIGFSPQMGVTLPLDAQFTDHRGERVRLKDCFRGRPTIVVPVYYRCPMLCGLEMNGLVRCLRGLTLQVGQDFDIVTFSIDPSEGPSLAAQKRKTYLAELAQGGAETGWHFLTGHQSEIEQLTGAIGFKSEFDPRTKQFAHAAGLVVCTPEGQIARYFYGVEFAPRDVKLALVEASRGEIGTLQDHIQLYCYMYDPTTGKYGIAILTIVRLAGILTVTILAISVVRMLIKERRNSPSGRKAWAPHG